MFRGEIKNELRIIFMDNKEIDQKITEIKVALHNLEKLGFDITELYKQLDNVGIEFYKFKTKNEDVMDKILKMEDEL